MIFVFLLISILSVGCVCAAEMDNTAVTDSSAIDGSLDIDDSISQHVASEGSSDESQLMELPKTNDKKLGDSDVPDSETSNGTEDVNGSGIDISGPKLSPDENITINGPKLDIKGPTIQVPLNISGPKRSLRTLQEEIDNAPAGSTLSLFMTYYADLSAFMVKINKDLTIDGRGHTIDCKSIQYSGVFLIKGGNVVLKNLKIVNSQNPYQGSGTVTITGSAQCTLINCTFENNWGNGKGSVICNEVNKPLTIVNCSFRNNEAGNSGIVWSAGVVNVMGSTFDSNAVYAKGGAIYGKNDVNIFNSSFMSNRAKAILKRCCGGAVCSEGNIYANNSRFVGNLALDAGGAICAEKDVSLENCLLESNVAARNYSSEKSFGGAVFSNGTVNATNSALNNNSVEGDGGGIFAAKDVNLDNCLFDSNVAKGKDSTNNGFGGSVCSKGTVNATDSAFNNNSGEGDDLGISAIGVNLISNQKDSDHDSLIDDLAGYEGDNTYIEATSTACDEFNG